MTAETEKLSYMDLESDLNDAVNMAEVACELIQNAGTKRPGGIIVTEHEWNLLIFAVFHASQLTRDMHARWYEIHNSNRGRA
jgi:hypothetical protein